LRIGRLKWICFILLKQNDTIRRFELRVPV
jgi:hypothetical protein